MAEDKPAKASGSVSRSTAEQVLARAADLDVTGDEMIDLQELRIAAEAAGISGQAFDMSVAELRRVGTPTVPEPAPVGRRVSYVKVMGVGVHPGRTSPNRANQHSLGFLFVECRLTGKGGNPSKVVNLLEFIGIDEIVVGYIREFVDDLGLDLLRGPLGRPLSGGLHFPAAVVGPQVEVVTRYQLEIADSDGRHAWNIDLGGSNHVEPHRGFGTTNDEGEECKE